MIRVRRVAALAIAGALLTGSVASPASAAPPVELNEALLAEALLTPTTAPGGGWTPAAPGVIESRPWALANDIEGGWCGGSTDAYAAGELQVAATAETTLAKVVAPDEPTWFIWTKAYSFPDVARAKSLLATVTEAAAGCEDWVLDGEPINGVSAETVTLPRLGNQRLGLRTTIVGDGVTASENFRYVRIRNNVVVTHTRIVPTDEALALSIAKLSARRLKQVVKAAT